MPMGKATQTRRRRPLRALVPQHLAPTTALPPPRAGAKGKKAKAKTKTEEMTKGVKVASLRATRTEPRPMMLAALPDRHKGLPAMTAAVAVAKEKAAAKEREVEKGRVRFNILTHTLMGLIQDRHPLHRPCMAALCPLATCPPQAQAACPMDSLPHPSLARPPSGPEAFCHHRRRWGWAWALAWAWACMASEEAEQQLVSRASSFVRARTFSCRWPTSPVFATKSTAMNGWSPSITQCRVPP
mmetsp:Transcript_35140/g.74768  ORF Transcript_35140/g.74768 Transcript_35140/m.74768 type:complete len:242 (+) Transcript_35140:1562-2287(+)